MGSAPEAKAQLFSSPIQYNHNLMVEAAKNPAYFNKSNQDFRPDTLFLDGPLGFFDDFSGGRSKLASPQWWMPNSGVYINNHFCVRPPTNGVATFDGLQANGTPYDSLRTGAAGYCDTLTSLPIDAEDIYRLNNRDSLFLSFYYQKGGPDVQMAPELFDSLICYFKAPNGVFERAWFAIGDTFPSTGANSFQKVVLNVPARYQYRGFQFRFVNYGTRNGAFDIFHIDYVYLNYGRDAADQANKIRDQGAVEVISPLLNPYTAVPRLHTPKLPSFFIRDTLKTRFSNWNNYSAQATETPFAINHAVIDSAARRIINQRNTPQDFSSEFPILGYFPFLRPFSRPDSFVVTGLASPRLDDLGDYLRNTLDSNETVLQQQVNLIRLDAINNRVVANDTVRQRTVLSNYYGYDDGSAENLRWVGGNLARMAMKFTNHKRDSLRGVRMLFPKTLQNLFPDRQITFTLFVWNQLRPIRTGQPDPSLFNLSVDVTPARSRDGFHYFRFRRPIIIDSGDFYIGWQQFSGIENEVRVGVDLNTKIPNLVFFNTMGDWQPDTMGTVLMIRPVFSGGKNSISSLANTQTVQQDIQFYPNPTEGRIFFSAPVQEVELLNAIGQRVFHTTSVSGVEELNLPSMPKGWYLMRFRGLNGQQYFRKLVR